MVALPAIAPVVILILFVLGSIYMGVGDADRGGGAGRRGRLFLRRGHQEPHLGGVQGEPGRLRPHQLHDHADRHGRGVSVQRDRLPGDHPGADELRHNDGAFTLHADRHPDGPVSHLGLPRRRIFDDRHDRTDRSAPDRGGQVRHGLVRDLPGPDDRAGADHPPGGLQPLRDQRPQQRQPWDDRPGGIPLFHYHAGSDGSADGVPGDRPVPSRTG